jgi:ABC-2 type transport system permease protein
MNVLIKYFRLWWLYTLYTTQIAFISRVGVVIFIVGKLLRFFFFLFFLTAIVSKTKNIAGYSLWQIIFFYSTFNLIDTLPQFFMREVYRFRSLVVSGKLDFVFIKPISPLFRALFGGSDALDLSILTLSVFFIIFTSGKIGVITPISVILYFMLIVNAFIIALAFHIFVVSMGILTTEVDNTIMLYRDLTQMGRFPVDIYRQPLQTIITFVIPIGIMMTFPAKAMMGLLSTQWIILSFAIAAMLLTISLLFWKYSLKQYTSASS